MVPRRRVLIDPSAAHDRSPEFEGADAPFDAVTLGPRVGGDSPLTLQTRNSVAIVGYLQIVHD